MIAAPHIDLVAGHEFTPRFSDIADQNNHSAEGARINIINFRPLRQAGRPANANGFLCP